VQDVLKDLQENNIDVSHWWFGRKTTASRQNMENYYEVQYTDIGVRNGRQLSAILSIMDN
jgi:hypothetical protein